MSLGNCDYTKIFNIVIIVRYSHVLMASAQKKVNLFHNSSRLFNYLLEKVIYHTDCYNNFSLFTETIRNALQQDIKATKRRLL